MTALIHVRDVLPGTRGIFLVLRDHLPDTEHLIAFDGSLHQFEQDIVDRDRRLGERQRLGDAQRDLDLDLGFTMRRSVSRLTP